MRSKIIATGIVLVLLACASMARAQTATGGVNGNVTDPSGAVVPGATVKLTNEATQLETLSKTNETGNYVFVGVQPGTYTLKLEMAGFKSVEAKGFKVDVSQTVTQNFTFEVGGVTETVEVDFAAPLVNSTSSELGTVIEQRVVGDLPLNGRNFTQLLTLTPGATPVSTSQNRTIGCCEGNVGLPGSGFSDASFHGQQNRSKLYFFDGIINTNIRGPTYIVLPNVDLVEEFKVVGHDAKAEFGGAAGGVVNMVSKAGGNGFHGSAFEYVRNDAFDARNTFTDNTRTKPAPFRQNQFGAILSGPIFKDKTFFSGGYDGWRYSQPGSTLSTVPTAAEIAGDFSASTGTRLKQIFNPYSTRTVGSASVRDPFRCDTAGNPLPVDAQNLQDQNLGTPCNKIPQAVIYGPMQQFFQKYATTPNYSVPGNTTQNFIQNRSTINNSNSIQVRIDHRLNTKDSMFFRYTEQRVSVLTPIGEVASTGGDGKGRNYGGGWTHVFGPKLLFDIRAGYAGRPTVDAGQQNTHPAGLDPLKQLGFKDVDKYGGLLVMLDNNEWTNGGNDRFGIRGAAPRENPNWSMTPNLTWIVGNHNMKMGGWYIEAKRIQENTFQTYTFTGEQTRNPAASSGTTGLSLASALLGFPNSFQGQLPVLHGGPVRFKYAAVSGFWQDEWKMRPTLTLTMGIRYDYMTQPRTLDGRLWNALDLQNQKWIIGARQMPELCSVTQQAPCIPDAFRSDPHFSNVVVSGKQFFAPGPVGDNWGPRIGLAWSITPHTILRTGYGLYWDAITARSQYAQNDLEMAVWPDATAYAGTVNAIADFTTGAAANIIALQSKGFPNPLPTTNPWTPANTFADDPKLKDPYSHQWHLEIQRELSPNLLFSVAYVGSKNGRLPYSGFGNTARQASPNGTPNATIDALRPMPWMAANINYTTSTGYSHYHALESKLQRRFSRGFHTLVSYTWSKSTDIGSGYFNAENGPGGGSTVQNYYDPNTARGVSSYDITHFLSWATGYELPFGKTKRWAQNGLASWIAGGWQANYIMQARTGQPYNLQISGDLANLRGGAPAAPGTYLRPNVIADPFTAGPVAANPDPLCQKTISQGGRAADKTHTSDTWFNPCAFGIPSGGFGNLGRNAFRGPAVFNTDFSLFKSFPVHEGMNLQLRFEAFNVFNIQNYDVPATSSLIINANATQIAANAGRVNALAQGTTPRQLQFGLRFVF
jgi:Carboxypeptidase regulatory-like domain/TonB dependent receptor-like, beta-barrel